MSLAVEVFDRTREKLIDLRAELQSCLNLGDFHRANEAMEVLRSYKLCAYCTSYRSSLEEVAGQGICGSCPLHRYGEGRVGHVLSYNGCYKIGEYRNMVKDAFWFRKDQSSETLRAVIDSITLTLDHMLQEKETLTHED